MDLLSQIVHVIIEIPLSFVGSSDHFIYVVHWIHTHIINCATHFVFDWNLYNKFGSLLVGTL